jgi:hypothetical protein
MHSSIQSIQLNFNVLYFGLSAPLYIFFGVRIIEEAWIIEMHKKNAAKLVPYEFYSTDVSLIIYNSKEYDGSDRRICDIMTLNEIRNLQHQHFHIFYLALNVIIRRT